VSRICAENHLVTPRRGLPVSTSMMKCRLGSILKILKSENPRLRFPNGYDADIIFFIVSCFSVVSSSHVRLNQLLLLVDDRFRSRFSRFD
jgi:hypothetical protein